MARQSEWKKVGEEFFTDAFGKPASITLSVSEADNKKFGARMYYRDFPVNVSVWDIPNIVAALQKIYAKFEELKCQAK